MEWKCALCRRHEWAMRSIFSAICTALAIVADFTKCYIQYHFCSPRFCVHATTIEMFSTYMGWARCDDISTMLSVHNIHQFSSSIHRAPGTCGKYSTCETSFLLPRITALHRFWDYCLQFPIEKQIIVKLLSLSLSFWQNTETKNKLLEMFCNPAESK